MANTMSTLDVCIFLGLLSLAHSSFSPRMARVSETPNDTVYTAFFDGSPDMVVQWEYRFDTIFPRDANEMTVNPEEASASLNLSGFHEIVRLVLYENERDMAGSKVYFLKLDREEMLPTMDVSLSPDVLHVNNTLYVNVTVYPPDRSFLDEFKVSAEFIGVDNSTGSPKIIEIPSFQHQAHIPVKKVSQEGDTYRYEITPPSHEGLLFVFSTAFAAYNREFHPGVAVVSVMRILPDGSSSLFQDGYFGVKSNTDGTGKLSCTSHRSVPCLVECVAMGPDIQGIELYAQNNSLAYTSREDIRHGDTFMRSRFSFDDKTLGEKGPLTCLATSGSRSVSDVFGVMVYEHVNITSADVESDGNQRSFHCSATGYPEPRFTIIINDKDRFFDEVSFETQIEDGVKTATYIYNNSDNVTMLNCQAQTDYSFDFKQIDNPT